MVIKQWLRSLSLLIRIVFVLLEYIDAHLANMYAMLCRNTSTLAHEFIEPFGLIEIPKDENT